MSDVFDDREKGYEAKFKLDEELVFKIRSRRNKLLGLWLAKIFGLDTKKTELYYKEVIIADLEEPGIEDLVNKIMHDIKARGSSVSENQLRDKIKNLQSIAKEQITKENRES